METLQEVWSLGEDELRREELDPLKKKDAFYIHLAAYFLVSFWLIAILVLAGGFFWPVFPILGWGIGVFFHGLAVFRSPVSNEAIYPSGLTSAQPLRPQLRDVNRPG